MAILLSKKDTRAPKNLVKERIKAKTEKILSELDDLQNLLYAEARHAVLLIFQGMDASGKDGLTRDVMGKLNPQGVTVQSFKAPTPEELSHDFLWRVHRHCPAKGMIQVFNRSHYEDVIATRIGKQCSDSEARERMRSINDFERLLTLNGTHILKFYLHVSHEEQRKRLEERIHDPTKQWKYDAHDFEDAKRWKQYMKYYEECFAHCNKVPWHIVPADQNWYKDFVVATALHKLLVSLKMKYPSLKKGSGS